MKRLCACILSVLLITITDCILPQMPMSIEFGSPLHNAAQEGRADIVALLIEKGADVNAKNNEGRTPLHEAVWFGSPNIVNLLLKKGADPLVEDDFGRTPLIMAQEKGNEHIRFDNKDTENAVNAKRKQTYATIARILSNAEKKFLKGNEGAAVAYVPKPAVKETAIIDIHIIHSDIDDLPSIKAKPNKNAYAIVIGIEQYRQKLPKADYATHDAQTVTEYLTKVMGYPEENVVTLTNDRASLTDFIKYFEKWLPNNVEKDSSVFIYYSGHGAPNVKTGDAYLVPYDSDPSFIEQTGYPLKKLYESLNKLQAKEIIVALDSCFSGAGGKSVVAKGARPLVMNLEHDIKLSKNMIVMSASSGDQISSTYEEKGHGLFTYFMLKGIKDGITEIGELFDYLKPYVGRTARKVYNNEQTPQLIAPEKKKVFLRN